MWTKILILMITFFLVANPATFKIMRGVLGGWVASSEGLATPAGLVLHAAVFVGLAIFLPKALMGASGFLTPRQAADAASREANRQRTRALKLEAAVRRELYEEEPEDYEEEPEDYEEEYRRRSRRRSRDNYEDEPEEYEDEDGEGYAFMSQAQRKTAEEARAAKYRARAAEAVAKLTAAGVPVPK